MTKLRANFLQAIALYLFSFAVFVFLITVTPAYFSTDDYYHVGLARQIIEQRQLGLNFPWLPQTILSNARFVDHHMLFHLYLVPWMLIFGDLGAKLATASIAATVILAAWALLKQAQIRAAWLWALAIFATSAPFLYRLLMIRTQGAALLCILLALLLLVQSRPRWLIPLAFAFVWLYNGFVLILGVVGLYACAEYITHRRILWRPVLYTFLGLALGLIINPYFPRNLLFAWEHLVAKVDFQNGVRVGQEWYPYNTAFLFSSSLGTFIAFIVGMLRPSFSEHRRTTLETALLFISVLTLFMLFQSRRFIEYFPVFPLLFCATAWHTFPSPSFSVLQRFIFIPKLLALFALTTFSVTTLQAVVADTQDVQSASYLSGAARWLTENTAQGSLVFQTDWDDFPYLFYNNVHNTYLVGLDPTYLERADLALWQRWVAITRGEVAHPASVIKTEFGASYVVSDLLHDDFADTMQADSNAQLVYRDEDSLIWKITLAEVRCDLNCSP